MKLLLPPDYVQNATEAIQNATERIVLISTVIADHPATHELIDALLIAARRGVKVSVAADVFTYGEVSGSFLPLQYYSKAARDVTRMGKLLRDAGIRFSWLGRAHMTIISGRNHSKWLVVDNTSYTFGGVNLYQEGIENADYMFKIRSKALADRIEVEYSRLITSDRTGQLFRSRQFDFNGDHVLIDGGILGNSIIYRRACDLAASAQSIIFVSQYPPTGKLARIFKTKQSRIYHNRPAQATGLNRLAINLSSIRNNITNSYRRRRYLHAKCMLFIMPDGSKVALTGSHNFNVGGVLLGAREIALETRDLKVIDQLETFVKNEVR